MNRAKLTFLLSALFPVFVSGHVFAAPAITMPSISEEACPLVSLNITSKDGNTVTAFARKPPGRGPYPALIHLHGEN